MAILRPDIYQHNNPNLAIVDGDNVYGGFRSSVSTVNDLYTLSGKTGTPTSRGQLKEFSTIIYVRGAEKYYVLKDINNVDNALGWEIFESTSGLDVNAVNIGGGEGLVYSSGNTGTTLQFRTIKGIGSTVVTTSGDTINIESSSGTTNVIGKNIGIGSGIYYGKVGTELQFKSILGSGNTTVSQSGGTIIVHSISGLTKADNGIGLSGDTIILGGELKHDTIIRGLTNSFTINTDIINLQSINGINIIDTDGGDGINIESDGGLISIVGRDNLEIEKTRVDISYSGLTITDSRTSQSGIEYASNYHSGYTNRSLVDKEYVDDKILVVNDNINDIETITDVAITGLTNGLSKIGRIGELGGTLTKATIICGSHLFGINATILNLTGSTSVSIGGSLFLKTKPTGSGGLLYRDGTTGEVCQTSIGSFGGVTGGTNGLVKDGQNVKLGGTLTETTIINGNLHSLSLGATGSKICELDMFVSSTTIDTGTLSISSESTVFTDTHPTPGEKRGIQYATDYSSSYNERSLVDKGYVDNIASGLRPKSSVFIATTGHIDLTGHTTIDGILTTDGMRVLVKDQTNAAYNGIYVASGGTWARAVDFDNLPLGEITQGSLVPVISGSSNYSSSWVLLTPSPITADVTPLEFGLFSRLVDTEGGLGIDVNIIGGHSVISVDLETNSGLEFSGGKLRVSSTIAGNALTWDSGVINVNAESGGIAGIPIRRDGSDNLVVNASDINTNLGGVISGATNGLKIIPTGLVGLGGELTEATILTINSDDRTLTITDTATTNKRGIIYGGDYNATFIDRSLVDKGYVDNAVTTSNKYNIKVITSDSTLNTTGHTYLINHASPITLTLPTVGAVNDGLVFKIKDVSGNAYTNIITIIGDIDGGSSASINTDHGALEIVYSHAMGAWYTLSFIN